MATLEERMAKKEAELKQLRAQLDARRARERTQSEKWRTSALIQMGGDVLGAAGLNWTQVDPVAFGVFLKAHKAELAGCKMAEPQDAKAAHAVWQEYKAAKREDAKESARKTAKTEKAAMKEEPKAKAPASKKSNPTATAKPDPRKPGSYFWTCPDCGMDNSVDENAHASECKLCRKKVEVVFPADARS